MRRGREWSDSYTVSTIFLSVGIGLLVVLVSVAAVLWILAAQRADWPRAEGTVVDVVSQTRSSTDSDGRTTTTTTFRPVVRYTVDGQEHEFTSRIGRGAPWPIGETVEVAYDPADPTRATIVGSGGWVPWMLSGMGVLFGVIFGGVGLLIRRGRMGAVDSGRRFSTSRSVTVRLSGSRTRADEDAEATDGQDRDEHDQDGHDQDGHDEPRGGPFG